MSVQYAPLRNDDAVPWDNSGDEVEEVQVPGKMGVPNSIFNTLACIIGGGVLALPYTFELTGLVLGFAIVAGVALLSGLGAYFLIHTSQIQFGRPASYRSLASENFGQAGVWFIEVSQVIDLIGGCAGYLFILGDIVTPFAQLAFGEDSWAADKRFALAAVVVLIPLPLSFIKQIRFLGFTSTISFFCIMFLTVCIVFRAAQDLSADSAEDMHVASGDLQEVRLAKWSFGIFRAIPVVSFAFNFHLQVYAIWNEMADRTKATTVFGSSILISVLLYVVVGVFGYLSFFRGTEENILANYNGDILFQISTALLGLMICFAYPLLSFPLLESFDSLAFAGAPMTYKRRIPEALILAVIAWGIAVATPNLSVVFGYAGATLGNLLVFIVPASFYIAAARYSPCSNLRKSERKWYRHPLLIAAWLLIGAASFLVVASLWAVTADLLPTDNTSSSLTTV